MPHRVLVVNENPSDRYALTELLANAGYDTTGATTFEEARAVLGESPPDLLIAHLRLGAFNGLHLVLRGRADRPDMCAIITTRPEDEAIKSEAASFGVVCVLTPVISREFLSVVAKVIKRRGLPVWH